MIEMHSKFYVNSHGRIIEGEISTAKCPISKWTSGPFQLRYVYIRWIFDSSHKNINHKLLAFTMIEFKLI